MSVVTPDQLHVNAVAKTPTSVDEIALAKSEIEGPLSKAFTNTKLTSDQKVFVLDLCARYRPVFALSMSELGRCTNAEATFPLPPDTRPIDRPPYRANPRAKAVIDKCVRLSQKKNGSSRFCVDYRHTLNHSIVRKCWPLPNLDSCLDAVGDVKSISTADVLSAFWQLPVAEEHIHRTAFVTPTGKFCFKRIPFGVCNAPWLFQHMMPVTFGHLGPESGILTYMDDVICLNSTFEAHLKSLEQMFSALQAAGLTLKPTKLQFGQKEIEYLGHVILEKGISISADRVKAI